jgi:electron transfer flavoprotein alpha subunit
VLSADSPSLANPIAGRYAPIIAQVVTDRKIDMVVAASTTFAKDIVGRAAGLLGGAMVSDVTGHEYQDGEFIFHRPMYAGGVTASVKVLGSPKIVTIRPAAYQPPAESETPQEITAWAVEDAPTLDRVEYLRQEVKASHRPDVTEARVVASGGRAFKNSEDFEQLVGRLADAFQGAAGSTRALVDAGITSNELQVGQTGKIVAPELYLALGISGAVQHLAGMKSSKVVVAVNLDAEAPIFQVADYGLIGDVYEVVPRLIEILSAD